MGSAKAQPSCLDKENLKNLRKQGLTGENSTHLRGGRSGKEQWERRKKGTKKGQKKGQKGS